MSYIKRLSHSLPSCRSSSFTLFFILLGFQGQALWSRTVNLGSVETPEIVTAPATLDRELAHPMGVGGGVSSESLLTVAHPKPQLRPTKEDIESSLPASPAPPQEETDNFIQLPASISVSGPPSYPTDSSTDLSRVSQHVPAEPVNPSFPFVALSPGEIVGNGTSLLRNSLDCTSDGRGSKLVHGGCGRLDGFRLCDETIWEGGWNVHQRRLDHAVTICDGSLSKIRCSLHSNSGKAGPDPVVRMCWVERLFAPKAASGAEGGQAKCADDRFSSFSVEPPECRFTAYCEPVGLWADRGKHRSQPGGVAHSLFAGFGTKLPRSPFGRQLIEVVSDKSQWPESSTPRNDKSQWVYISLGDCSARHSVDVSSGTVPTKTRSTTIDVRDGARTLLAKGNDRKDPVDKAAKERARKKDREMKLAAVAMGKRVTSAFNPAHCHADLPIAALVVASMAKFFNHSSTIDWTALLLVGHHYYQEIGDNRRDSARADTAMAALQRSNKAADYEVLGHEAALADRWPVFAAWHALFQGQVLTREGFYSSIGKARPRGGRESDDPIVRRGLGPRGFYPGEEISVAVLPPNSMSSLWWAPHTCRAARRSPVLAEFRSRSGPLLDTLAVHAWVNGQGARVIAKAEARHWPQPLKPELGRGPKLSTTVAQSKPEKEAIAWDWLARGDLVIVVDRAKERGRAVHNSDELWNALRHAFRDRALLRVVTDSRMPYLAQYALWRSAALVIGVHGGNLGGAIWLSPGQGLIELGFTGCASKPTQFMNAAASLGARYRCVALNEGANKEEGGRVNSQVVVEQAKQVLLPW